MKILVMIPVYNEGERAVRVIKDILKMVNLEIIVVDDGSSDGSFQIIKNAFKKNKKVKVFSHLVNLGKGAAMKTGMKLAWKMGAEAIVFIDADGQHSPKYLPEFIKKLNDYPLVFGYRVLDKNAPWIRRTGNKIAGWFIGNLFKIKRKDLLCGFMAIRKDVYKKVKWQSCRYGVETEIATKVGKNKLPFSELKIDTIYIDKYKGMTLFDSFKILLQIPYWYFEK